MVRPFGSLIEKGIKFREPSIPDARLERVNPPAMHRLDDGITELFNNACINNDLEAAADLIALSEKWRARRSYEDENQRRLDGVRLKRMHGELERRHIVRGTRPATS